MPKFNSKLVAKYRRWGLPLTVTGLCCGLVWLIGCAKTAPPVPPSLELAKPVRDLTATRQGNRVLLRFSLTNHATDGGSFRAWGPVRICRAEFEAKAEPMVNCSTVLAALRGEDLGLKVHQKEDQQVVATFEDTVPAARPTGAAATAVYAVEVLNSYGRSAGLGNQVTVPLAPALAAPSEFHAEVVAEGVALTWQPVALEASIANVNYEYRIERRDAKLGQSGSGDAAASLACVVPLGTGSRCLDYGTEWEKPVVYAIRVATLLPDRQVVMGEVSAPIHMLAHDIFPPGVPQGVQAVASGAGQQVFVDLTWTPDTDADLTGYNVYRREDNGAFTKLNATVVAQPSYRDDEVTGGKKYFYVITALDVRANESAKSEEASETVP